MPCTVTVSLSENKSKVENKNKILKNNFVGLLFPVPCVCLLYFFSPLSFVTQINHCRHIAGTPPPSPVRFVPPFYSLIARTVQHFLPSSTRVELCVHTVGAF